MAYANHVSHVISILCAIKKFNYLFHLLMKLICWLGFLCFFLSFYAEQHANSAAAAAATATATATFLSLSHSYTHYSLIHSYNESRSLNSLVAI